MPEVLNLAPEQSGYTAEDGEETLSVRLRGGASRFRRDILGAAARVRAQWLCTEEDYDYLKAFYRVTGSGADPFLVDLILGTATPVQHEAHFVPGTMRLVRQQGLSYTVEAELEVTPPTPDEDLDEGLVAVYGAYGDGAAAMLLDLEEFANEDLPESLGP